ncbi:unnamed protein product [Calicophoron daubneyi]|uniref:Saposin-like type B region 1 domain-containing protein n=1 Tax=Calicophoron daubneyi TaxID=300641 RepID=A0AAV2TDX4_CALDB
MNALFAVLFIVVAAQAKPIKTNSNCDLCLETMDKVKNLILGGATEADVLEEVLYFCSKMPLKERCKAKAKDSVKDWVKAKNKFYADEACLRLKACRAC